LTNFVYLHREVLNLLLLCRLDCRGSSLTAQKNLIKHVMRDLDFVFAVSRRFRSQGSRLWRSADIRVPLGTFAPPQNFPIRNRITSAMSFGMPVVEAAEYSGTASPRGVLWNKIAGYLRVPGNVTNKNFMGTEHAVKQGARVLATWEDAWEELPADVRLALTAETGNESPDSQTASLFEEPSLSPHEKKDL
jgi:hypothetical protein